MKRKLLFCFCPKKLEHHINGISNNDWIYTTFELVGLGLHTTMSLLSWVFNTKVPAFLLCYMNIVGCLVR